MLEAEAKLNLVDIYKKNPNMSQNGIMNELQKRMTHTGANAQITTEVLGNIGLDGKSNKPLEQNDLQKIF